MRIVIMGKTIIPQYLIKQAFSELRSELLGDDRPRNILKQIKRIERDVKNQREMGRSFTDSSIVERFGELVYDIADYWGHTHADKDTIQNAADTAFDILYKCVDELENVRYEYMEN